MSAGPHRSHFGSSLAPWLGVCGADRGARGDSRREGTLRAGEAPAAAAARQGVHTLAVHVRFGGQGGAGARELVALAEEDALEKELRKLSMDIF